MEVHEHREDTLKCVLRLRQKYTARFHDVFQAYYSKPPSAHHSVRKKQRKRATNNGAEHQGKGVENLGSYPKVTKSSPKKWIEMKHSNYIKETSQQRRCIQTPRVSHTPSAYSPIA